MPPAEGPRSELRAVVTDVWDVEEKVGNVVVEDDSGMGEGVIAGSVVWLRMVELL